MLPRMQSKRRKKNNNTHLLLCADRFLWPEPDDDEIDMFGLGEHHLSHEAGTAQTSVSSCNQRLQGVARGRNGNVVKSKRF